MRSATLLLRRGHDVSKSRVRGRRPPSRAPRKHLLSLPSLPPTARTHSGGLAELAGVVLKGKKWRSVFGQLAMLAFAACHLSPQHLGCRGPGVWGSVRIYPPLTQTLFGDLCAGPSLGGIKCSPSINQSPFGLSSHDFLDPSFSNKRTHHWMPVIASLQEFCRTTQIYFQPPDRKSF